MFKKNRINIIVACFIVIMAPIIALLIPKNQQKIENAVVNSITGDIAIVYYNFVFTNERFIIVFYVLVNVESIVALGKL